MKSFRQLVDEAMIGGQMQMGKGFVRDDERREVEERRMKSERKKKELRKENRRKGY